MKFGMPGLPGLALMAALCLGLAPAGAQAKPAESTSKIKKVLLYNKIGGWMAVDGIADVKAAFSTLAAAKGFELVQLDEDVGITLEYLKQFQVIVWNNNTNGLYSMPSATARQAVLDYVDQGGGWMLICNAGDHQNTWPGLAERIGTGFMAHFNIGYGEVVLDRAASAHGELKWMVEGFPEVFQLNDLWFSFQKTVRPLPGVTVVATSRGIPGIPNVVHPPGDSSGDNAYIWAREVGRGRLLYNAIGFGQKKIMEQKDGIVPRLYWENLRYAAGDFQNGCTTPASPGYNSAARVHVEAMCSTTGLTATPALPNLVVSKGGRRMRFAHTPSRPFTIRVRDIRGAKVWERTLPAGTGEIALDDAIKPGVYHFEVLGPAHAIRQRLLLP
jgi:hypothetical protein